MTTQDLKEFVEENYPSIDIFWDYRDGFDIQDVRKLVEAPEGEQEIADTLWRLNVDSFARENDRVVEAVMSWVEKQGGILDDDPGLSQEGIQGKVEELVNALPLDLKLDDLARNTGRIKCVARFGDPFNYQNYRGLESLDDALLGVLKLLRISPHHLEDLKPNGSALELPVIEYETPPAVSVKRFLSVMSETAYGGHLCFMVHIPCIDLLRQRDGYRSNDLLVKAGTLVTLNCYECGATAMDEAALLVDLVLPAAQVELIVDEARGYGIQNVCQLTNTPWDRGEIKPIENHTDARH